MFSGVLCTSHFPQREELPVYELVCRVACRLATTAVDCCQGSPGRSGCSQMSAVECLLGSCRKIIWHPFSNSHGKGEGHAVHTLVGVWSMAVLLGEPFE